MLVAQRQARSALERGRVPRYTAMFETPDGGHEWMWVEVVRWKGKTMVVSGDFKRRRDPTCGLFEPDMIAISEAVHALLDPFHLDHVRSYPKHHICPFHPIIYCLTFPVHV